MPQRLAEFVEQVLAQGRQTRGRHVMLTMGSDFQFQSAEDWYRNLDKLIRAAMRGAAALAASLYESVDASFVISLCTVSDGEDAVCAPGLVCIKTLTHQICSLCHRRMVLCTATTAEEFF